MRPSFRSWLHCMWTSLQMRFWFPGSSHYSWARHSPAHPVVQFKCKHISFSSLSVARARGHLREPVWKWAGSKREQVSVELGFESALASSTWSSGIRDGFSLADFCTWGRRWGKSGSHHSVHLRSQGWGWGWGSPVAEDSLGDWWRKTLALA